MASVRDTVKYGLLEFPTIFPNVGAMLHHLFAVNGNGCEWERGELVNVFTPMPQSIDVERIAAGERACFIKQIASFRERGFDDCASLDCERELLGYEFTVANIDRLTTDSAIRSHDAHRSLYPCCEYARIFHVPDDVQLDWLWAAYAFVDRLQTHLRSRYSKDADELGWEKELPALRDKFDAMLVERGAMASRKERAALMDEIIAEIKREEG